MAWPTDITVTDKGRVLEVVFDDGETVTAERLRVESPSAEVQGHSPAQKRIVTGKENVQGRESAGPNRYKDRTCDPSRVKGVFYR